MKKVLKLVLIITVILCAMFVLSGFDCAPVAQAETEMDVDAMEIIDTANEPAIFNTYYETQSTAMVLSAEPNGLKTYVRGKLEYQYKDLNNVIVTAPLRNIKVALWDKDILVDDRIAETYTNEYGDYYFAFENGHGIFERNDDVYIRFFTSGETYNVMNFSNYCLLKHGTNVLNGEPDETRVEPKDLNMWRYFGIFRADNALCR